MEIYEWEESACVSILSIYSIWISVKATICLAVKHEQALKLY